MKILVLGSEGFIGNHCVAHFVRNGCDVTGVDLFEQPSQSYRYVKVSRLSPELDDLFGQFVFDAVVNAAGSGNVPYSMSHPLLDFEANSLDTIRVLDAIRKHQSGSKYVHLSSAAVYGNPRKLPISEVDALNPLSPYGWHKLIAEQVCSEYTSVFGLRTAIVRPFSVYGPGLKKQLFWDVYQKAKQSDTVSLLGTGQESRDYVFISDLIAAIDCVIAQSPMRADAYNVAFGNQITIQNAVTAFLSALGMRKSLFFNDQLRSGDPVNWRADVSKLRSIGFNAQVPLTEGLKEVASWISRF